MAENENPHPAVALILQHLRFEAHPFDVAASAGERDDGDRKNESDGGVDCQFNTLSCKLRWQVWEANELFYNS